MLYKALRDHRSGLWSEFNIPASFKNVIWSDYVFLYALLYFGLYVMILLMVLLIVFLSHLTYIAYLSLNSRAVFAQKEEEKEVSLLGTLIGLILLGYVAQYLYMMGSVFRVFPLTGQSMPFFSVSWTEPLILCVFLIGAYACFYMQTRRVETSPEIGAQVCKHASVFRAIVLFFVFVVAAMVFCVTTERQRFLRVRENTNGSWKTLPYITAFWRWLRKERVRTGINVSARKN